MAEVRLKTWEVLFGRALALIDSIGAAGGVLDYWSFGGGTVLMRRYRHRYSKDIDIFVPDPQCLGFFTPRLSDKAESLTTHYIEQAGFVKLFFPEGEIDFVASGPLTQNPTIPEQILGREVHVETSTEIIAKKIWHRGVEFTARDIFDFSMVLESEPEALAQIRPILRDRRQVVLERIKQRDTALRDDYAALEILDYRRSYDECVERVTRALDAASR